MNSQCDDGMFLKDAGYKFSYIKSPNNIGLKIIKTTGHTVLGLQLSWNGFNWFPNKKYQLDALNENNIC